MTPSFHARLINGRFGDPALYVSHAHERGSLLFDLGDLHPLSARDLLRVDHAFVSHLHMDHWVGFDAWLRLLVGRAKRVALAGPPGLADAAEHKLRAYAWDLVDRYEDDLVIDVTELVAPERVRHTRFRLLTAFARDGLGEADAPGGVVAETPAFTVRAVELEHHGPSLAFTLEEPVHVNVWRNRVEERGLAVGAWLKPLKEAVRDGLPDDHPVMLPDGGTAPLGTLRDLVSVEPGQKLAYATDLRDTPANRTKLAHLARDADTLWIESAFAAADKARAEDRAHLTTTAAGEIARAARARRVEPFHFSPRYEGREAEMLAEVEAAFSNHPSPT